MPELDALSRALSFTTPSVKVSTRLEAYSCKPIHKDRKLLKTLEADLKSDLELTASVSPPDQVDGVYASPFGPLDQRQSRKTLWLLISTLNLAFPDHDFSKVRPEEFTKEPGSGAVLASLGNALDHLKAPDSLAQQRSFSAYPPGDLETFQSLFGAGSRPSTGLSSSAPGTLESMLMAQRRAFTNFNPGAPHQTQPTTSAGYGFSYNTPRQFGHADPHRGMSPSEMARQDAVLLDSAHPALKSLLDPVINLSECEVFSYMPDTDSDPHASVSDDEDAETTFADEDDEEDGMEQTWEMDGLPRPLQPLTPRRASRRSMQAAQGNNATPAKLGRGDSYHDASGGLLWSSNFFWYNRKLKRILFISIWARRNRHGGTATPQTPSSASESHYTHTLDLSNPDSRGNTPAQDLNRSRATSSPIIVGAPTNPAPSSQSANYLLAQRALIESKRQRTDSAAGLDTSKKLRIASGA
ncbi:uncharacterized protein L969DRAFT_95606 [Mixia osmundae IAM 14324]|nr:uncharacterized protein L969DRAFT_95606 [Mixia osmundae IAM 14324]KEI38529.1 hypothetical protein L969DRAFT_95606 [Mixia osmundae IAM 14324]